MEGTLRVVLWLCHNLRWWFKRSFRVKNVIWMRVPFWMDFDLNIACLEGICYWKEYFIGKKIKWLTLYSLHDLYLFRMFVVSLDALPGSFHQEMYNLRRNCSLLTCQLLNYLNTILFDVASLLLKGMILEVLFYSVLQIQSKWNLAQIMKLAQCFHSVKIMRRNILCLYLSL